MKAEQIKECLELVEKLRAIMLESGKSPWMIMMKFDEIMALLQAQIEY